MSRVWFEIGIHAGLGLTSIQRQAYRVLKEFSERSSGGAGSQLVQVRISLPCAGGSPFLYPRKIGNLLRMHM